MPCPEERHDAVTSPSTDVPVSAITPDVRETHARQTRREVDGLEVPRHRELAQALREHQSRVQPRERVRAAAVRLADGHEQVAAPPGELDGGALPSNRVVARDDPSGEGPDAHHTRDADRVVPAARRARPPPRIRRAPPRGSWPPPRPSPIRPATGARPPEHVGSCRCVDDGRRAHVRPPTGGTRAAPADADASAARGCARAWRARRRAPHDHARPARRADRSGAART